MPDKVKTLYDNMPKYFEGFNVPYEVFIQDMQDENKLQSLHTNLQKKVKGFNVPYDVFKSDMGYVHKDNNGISIVDESQLDLPEEKKNTGSYLGDLGQKILAAIVKLPDSAMKGVEYYQRLQGYSDGIPEIDMNKVSELSQKTGIPEQMFIDAYNVQSGKSIKPAMDLIRQTDIGKKGQDIEQNLLDKSDRYDGKTTTELWKEGNYSSAVGNVFLQGAESLPQSMLAAFGGAAGLASLGFMAAGEQYDQLDDRTDMSEGTKLINATLNGGFEVLTEYFGSKQFGDLLKSLYKQGGKKGVEEIVKNTSKNFFQKAFKKYGLLFAPVGEGVEEFSNQIASNITARLTGEDVNRGVMDGVWDAFLAGVGGGSYFTAFGIPGMVNQSIKSKEKQVISKGLGESEMWSENQLQKEVREKRGNVLLGVDNEDNVIEIVGKTEDNQLFGYTPKGDKVTLSTDMLKEQVQIPIQQFNNLINTHKQEKPLRDALQKEAFKSGQIQQIDALINNIKSDNNEVIKVTLADGNNYYVKTGDIDNPSLTDPIIGINEQTGVKQFLDPTAFVNTIRTSADAMRTDMIFQTLGEIEVADQQLKQNQAEFVKGQPIEVQGKKGVVSDVTNIEQGVGVQFEDGTSTFIKPEQYGSARVNPTQEQTQEEVQKKERDLVIDEKTSVKVRQNDDGTFTVGDVISDERQANKLVKQLSSRYANSEFQVINEIDKNDPFAVNQYKIIAKPRLNEVQETEQAEQKGTTQEVQQSQEGAEQQGAVQGEITSQKSTQFATNNTQSGITTQKTTQIIPEQVQSDGIDYNKEYTPKEKRELLKQRGFRSDDFYMTDAQVEEAFNPGSEKTFAMDVISSMMDPNSVFEITSFLPINDAIQVINDIKSGNVDNELTNQFVKYLEDSYKSRILSEQGMEIDDLEEDVALHILSQYDGELSEIFTEEIAEYAGEFETLDDLRRNLSTSDLLKLKDNVKKKRTDKGTENNQGQENVSQVSSTRTDEGRTAEPIPAQTSEEINQTSGNETQILPENSINKSVQKAEQDVNTNPTEAQKEAGNYKKGHVTVQGLDITIENPKGSLRSGVDTDGETWEQVMNNTYGYFKRTQGKDGDQIDVFLGENLDSDKVFIVDQINPKTKEFDESKVMLGFNTIDEAKQAYLSNYEDNWQGLGEITESPIDDFKVWLNDGKRQNKAFAEYKSHVSTSKNVTEDVAKKATPEEELLSYFSSKVPENDNKRKKSLSTKKVIDALNEQISDIDNKIKEVKAKRNAKKKELEGRRATQQNLFLDEIIEKSLFNVQQDFSKENIDKALQDFDGEIKKLQDQRLKLEESKERTIKEASGQKDLLPERPSTPGEELDRWVADYSDDPLEIYTSWVSQKENTPDKKLNEVEKAVLETKVNKDSFIRYSDANNITSGLAKSWFTKDYKTTNNIDIIAEDLSDKLNREVTPDEIVDVILKYPDGYIRKTTDLQKQLESKYKKITGESIKSARKDEIEFDETVPFKVKDIANELDNKNLIALHNLNEGNILNAEELGGLVTPSIAITKDEYEFTDFGPITLIADKDLINPESSDVKVFKGDVYSPSVPRPYYHVDKKAQRKWGAEMMNKAYKNYREIASKISNIVDDYGNFIKDLERRTPEEIKNYLHDDLKLAYLVDHNIPIDIPMNKTKIKIGFNSYIDKLTLPEEERGEELINRFKEETKSSSGDLTEKTRNDIANFVYDITLRYFNEQYKGVDEFKDYPKELAEKYKESFNIHYFTDYLSKYLHGTKELDQTNLKSKIDESFNKNVKKKDFDNWVDNKINELQGAKYFEKGNKKIPYTLYNLIDATIGRTRGQEKGMTFGMNKAKSYAIKQLKSLDAIRKNKDILISKQEMTDIDKQMSEEYFNLAERLGYKYSDQWGKLDDLGRSIADYYKSGNAKGSLIRNGFTGNNADEFKEFADKLGKNPVDYFEAKIQRAVKLNEFKYAVVPESTSPEVIKLLKNKGLDVRIYNGSERKLVIDQIVRENPDIRFKVKPLYSNTEKALESIKQEKATPEQWKAMLLKNGSKQAELDWMGFDDFVKDKKSLTKDDLTEFVNSNKVEIQEVEKSDISELNKRKAFENKLKAKYGNEWYKNLTDEEQVQWDILQSEVESSKEETTPPKYGKYVLPGGENYKELLLTMPERRVNVTYSIIDDNVRYGGNYKVKNNVTGEEMLGSFKTREAAEKWISGQSGMRYSTKDNFKSSHFEEPNILAHVRFNERTDSEGNRVLFIEEFQSDWAQKGKKQGFQEDVKPEWNEALGKEAVKTIRANDNLGFDSWQKAAREIMDDDDFVNTFAITNKDDAEILTKWRNAAKTELKYKNSVPNMPFKQTNQWLGLAFKRMVQYAAENGFDKVAWTTGEQQAERYDLSKQVENIIAKDNNNGTWNLQIGIKGTVRAENYFEQTPEQIESLLGKEIAKKISNNEGELLTRSNERMKKNYNYSGVDLKVGGEGMKAFYDQIVPSFANKFGKKFDAKVETIQLNANREVFEQEDIDFDIFGDPHPIEGSTPADIEEELIKVNSLPLTDKLTETALQGFPMFNVKNPSNPNNIENLLEYSDKRKEFEQSVNNIAEHYSNILNSVINVIKNETQLPEGIKQNMKKKGINPKSIPGVFYPKNGEVYLMTDYIDDTNEAKQVILHEIVAHKGLRGLLGSRFNNVLSDIYDSMSQEDINRISKLYGTTNPLIIADEFLAEQAEKDNKPNFIQRAISKLKAILRKIFKIKYSNTDIDVLLKNSAEYLKNNREEILDDTKFESTNDPLKFVMSGINQIKAYTGNETLGKTKNGIKEYIGEYGSTRYVKYVDGVPVAGIQVMSNDEISVISNAYTKPNERRKGYARELIERAKETFPNLKHNTNLTTEGEFLAEGVMLKVNPQTETKAFKDWFGDSKVVDENGKPLVVYHGGPNKINIFDERFGGMTTADNEYGAFYFSNSKEVADDYSKEAIKRIYQDNPESLVSDGIISQDEYDKLQDEGIDWYEYVEEYADNNIEVVDAFIRLENPLIIDAKHQNLRDLEKKFNIQGAIGYIKGKGGEMPDQVYDDLKYDKDIIEQYQGEINEMVIADNGLENIDEADEWMVEDATRNVLEENDIYPELTQYDGIIINNVIDDIGYGSQQYQDVYIVIEPTQIKSATGNTGNFDPNNPDIRFKKKPLTSQNVTSNVKEEKDITDLAREAIERTPNTKGWKETFNSIRQAIQDKDLPIRDIENEVKRRGGKVTDKTKPYRDKNLSFGRIEALWEDFRNEYMKPVYDAVANLKKQGMAEKDVMAYMIAKHAPERNRRIRDERFEEWLMKNEDATFDQQNKYYESLKKQDFSGVLALDKTGEYKNKPDEFAQELTTKYEEKFKTEDFWPHINKATNYVLDRWLDGKQITREQLNKYQRDYRYYIPLRGWYDAAQKYLNYHFGYGKEASLKKAEGRTSLPDNPLIYIEQAAFNSIGEQVTNEVNQAMMNLIIENYQGNEDLFRVKKVYYVLNPATNEFEPTIEVPSKEMFDNGTARTEYYNQHQKLRKPSQASEHEVWVDTDTGTFTMIFPDKYLEVAQALNNQNDLIKLAWFNKAVEAGKLNDTLLVRNIGSLTNLMKALFTSWNIVFPVTNLMRDWPEAMTHIMISQSGKQGLNFAKTLFKNSFKTVGTYLYNNKKFDPKKNDLHRLFNEFREDGGQTGFTHSKTPEDLEESIRKEVNKATKKYHIGKFTDQLERFSQLFEDASRFATYASARKSGMERKEAASLAKEATVNFNRKGQISKVMDATYAFFNVAIQSAQKNMKLAKNYPKRFAIAGASWMLLGGLITELNRFFDDDDEYEQISDWVRQNYIVLPMGEKYLRVPLPQFFRSFYSWGVLVSDLSHGKKKAGEASGSAMVNLIASLSPIDPGGFIVDGEWSWGPLVPTFYKPIHEISVNRNYLGGRIYKEAFTKQLEDDLANARMGMPNVNPIIRFATEALFKAGGGREDSDKVFYNENGDNKRVKKIFDWNPSKIEHIIKSYSGGTGSFINDVATTLLQMVTPEETVDADNIPYINAFIRKYPEKKWSYIREYYDYKDKVRVHETTMKTYENNPKKYDQLEGDSEYNLLKDIIEDTEYKLDDFKEDFDEGRINIDKYLELRSNVIEKALKQIEYKKKDKKIASGLIRDYQEQLDQAKITGSQVLIDKIQEKINKLRA